MQALEEYGSFLESQRLVGQRQLPYYVGWAHPRRED